MPIKKRESVIEDHFTNEAKKRKYLCFKFMSGRNGVPDRILIGNSQTVFVELKRPNEKAEVLQKAVHRNIKTRGGKVYVLDTIEKIDKFYEAFDKKEDYKDEL